MDFYENVNGIPEHCFLNSCDSWAETKGKGIILVSNFSVKTFGLKSDAHTEKQFQMFSDPWTINFRGVWMNHRHFICFKVPRRQWIQNLINCWTAPRVCPALFAHRLHKFHWFLCPYCDMSQVRIFQHTLLFVGGASFFGFLSACLWYVALAITADFQDNKNPTTPNL